MTSPFAPFLGGAGSGGVTGPWGRTKFWGLMEMRLPASAIEPKSRAVSWAPQAGHTAFSSRSARLARISKVSPHALTPVLVERHGYRLARAPRRGDSGTAHGPPVHQRPSVTGAPGPASRRAEWRARWPADARTGERRTEPQVHDHFSSPSCSQNSRLQHASRLDAGAQVIRVSLQDLHGAVLGGRRTPHEDVGRGEIEQASAR